MFLTTNFLVLELESLTPQVSYYPFYRSSTISTQFTPTQRSHVTINYSFWVITQRVVFISRRFGTPWFHLLDLPRIWKQQDVPKHRPVSTTRLVVTKKVELIIQPMEKS